MQKTLTMAAVVATAACGPASVSGTFDGEGITISEAAATFGEVAGVETVNVLLAGASGVCSDEPVAFVANTSFIAIGLGNQDGSVDASDYTVATIGDTDIATRAAFVTVGRTGDTCSDTTTSSASSGTVTLTSASKDGGVSGSFKITVDDEELSGSFSATACDELAEAEACEE